MEQQKRTVVHSMKVEMKKQNSALFCCSWECQHWTTQIFCTMPENDGKSADYLLGAHRYILSHG